MEKFSVNASHGQLLKAPEFFKVTIDMGNAAEGIVPALNKESAIALMDIFRFATKPKVRGYILERKSGEMVAAVQAADYIDSMTKGTSLRGEPAKKEEPAVTLPFWDLTTVKPEKPMADGTSKLFTLEIVIDSAVEKFQVSAINKESMISLLTQATCERLPRISGWNLFEGDILVASVPAVAFIGELAEKTGLGKKPADPKAAGWSVVPAIAPTTEDFGKMIEKAKQEGRLPQGR